jgi:hypothetical protein
VHYDAQLAVVRIRLGWVGVNYLGDNQQRQQHQTDQSDDTHETVPRAAPAAEKCLEAFHPIDLNLVLCGTAERICLLGRSSVAEVASQQWHLYLNLHSRFWFV